MSWFSPFGFDPYAQQQQRYGYGSPLRIDYHLEGQPCSVVLETVRAGPFGHEHMADRAQMMLWDHRAYNSLARHARSLDVGAFDREGNLLSVGSAEEFFLLVEHVEGDEIGRAHV